MNGLFDTAARERYIVTGGGGFVGGAIARRLAGLGTEVVSLSRRTYPALESHGIRSVAVDLADELPDSLTELFRGAAGVFHVAAKVDMWGKYEDFRRANVLATTRLLELCRATGVGRFVFTSSPSVVADGGDLRGVDEAQPYPAAYEAFYPETKAAAERAVVAANSPMLATVALRPHLIFGPDDTHLLPTVVARARAGRLVRIGRAENIVDFTYIDDCVDAHLAAMRALGTNPNAGGRAFFISQGDPVKMWWWIDEVVRAYGCPPITKRVPRALAHALAAVSEGWARIRGGSKEPYLTRFLVTEMATDHFFDISAARRELGYAPVRSVADALRGCVPAVG